MSTTNITTLCDQLHIPTPIPLGSDAVISGSFMWHVLTADEKTKWLPNDLDIFCTREAVPRFREYLVDNKFKLCFIQKFEYIGMNTRIIEEWAVPNTPKFTKNKFGDTSETFRKYYKEVCTEYKLPQLPETVSMALKRDPDSSTNPVCVQLIISDSFDVKEASDLIKDRFDFPTLENWFDGKEIHVSYPEYVKSKTSLVKEYKETEEDPVLLSIHLGRVEKRRKKYTQRGLHIQISEQLQKYINTKK